MELSRPEQDITNYSTPQTRVLEEKFRCKRHLSRKPDADLS
jgi:hypothetical protein